MFCLLLTILLAIATPAHSHTGEGIPAGRKIQVERLPDLNIARCGHQVLLAGGELTVFGGHTTGFIPTPTAEYLKDGQWHSVPMTYPHDDALATMLSTGEVLLAGGHKENLGIGQTFETEVYDPATHTFGNYGCMDRRRTLATGTTLDSGHVVISGNWYGADATELYDGERFSFVKPTSVGRAAPFILRTTDGDAIIFGSMGTRGQDLGDSTAIVDRLRGEPFTVPLLRQWKPVGFTIPPHYGNIGCIGDAHLLLASDSSCHNYPPCLRTSHPSAILMVRDTVFSLLSTDHPIPQATHVGDTIFWDFPLVADRQHYRAYLPGIDKDKRLYLFTIDISPLFNPDGSLSNRRSQITNLKSQLYFSDPLPLCGFNTPVLTAEGDLAIIGGNHKGDFHTDNYTPCASAWLIRLGSNEAASAARAFPSTWMLVGLLAAGSVIAAILYHRHRKPAAKPVEEEATSLPTRRGMGDEATLFPRILDLMNRQQLFLNPELKAADVAAALATNLRYVTDSIRAERDQTFTQFVNDLRLAYAQQLLLRHPDKKVVEIATEAGFSSERSFFRIFKTTTGMTTQEWIQQNTK